MGYSVYPESGVKIQTWYSILSIISFFMAHMIKISHNLLFEKVCFVHTGRSQGTI